MPKYNYDLNNWAIPKKCSYCGKTFYPIKNEHFCNWNCETSYADYIKWYDDLLLNEFIKKEQLNDM
jgi:hypothetical protein